MRLRDDVTGTSSGQAGVLTKLATEQLNVYPDTRRAASPGRVVITRPGSILSGHGLQLDLATKQYSFKSEVHYRYARAR